jgi:hypothetical protein
MPKATVHGGGSVDPMDATNDIPSEEDYNDAMSRHGTDQWTEADAKVEARWLELRQEEAEEEAQKAAEARKAEGPSKTKGKGLLRRHSGSEDAEQQ